MNLDPSVCWDCPISIYQAVATAGVALLALWTGLLLRRHRRRGARWFGLALLLLAGLAATRLSLSVSLHGIGWPGVHPWVADRRRGLDAAFLGLVLGLLALLLSRTRRRKKDRDEG